MCQLKQDQHKVILTCQSAWHPQHGSPGSISCVLCFFRGNKVVKVLGGLLVVAVAGVAALQVKQEFDKRPRTQHEYLVIDDEDLSKRSRIAKDIHADQAHRAAKAAHASADELAADHRHKHAKADNDEHH